MLDSNRLTKDAMDDKDRLNRDTQVYIVRLWRSGADGRWFGSVQDVANGERQGFATLENLFAYLRERAEGAAGSTRGPPGNLERN